MTTIAPCRSSSALPTALERIGDFSQTLNKQGGKLTIYDPQTTVMTGGTATRQPFPNNIIPANRIDPTGKAVLNLFPLPNQSGPAQIGLFNWVDTSAYEVKQRDLMGRIDQYVSDRHRLFFRYGQANRTSDLVREFFPGNNCGNCSHASSYYINVGIDDTFTFSPTFIGNFRLGMVRVRGQNTRGGDGKIPPYSRFRSRLFKTNISAATRLSRSAKVSRRLEASIR